MKSEKNTENFAIKLTFFVMKFVGLWTAENDSERRLRRIAISYTLSQNMYSIFLEGRDLFYTWPSGDMADLCFILVNIVIISMTTFKVVVMLVHKDELLWLVSYARQNFWNMNRDAYERKILLECGQMCTLFICCFTFFIQCTILGYMINPLIVNIGKNESDRIFIYNMWMDLPLEYTPYFEVTFISQTLMTYHVGVCFFCFDNCLCLLCLYTAGQFRILQYRLSKLSGQYLAYRKPEDDSPDGCYGTLKDCIRMHQDLIGYCNKMETVFSKMALAQVVLFSFLMCFTGFQMMIPDIPVHRRIAFLLHNLGDFCQLMMFTYSCGDLMDQSGLVETEAYFAPWPSQPMTKAGVHFRKDVLTIIARAHRPCCLTAYGFFPIRLETYTGVMSTAASYFTLLRQTNGDIG